MLNNWIAVNGKDPLAVVRRILVMTAYVDLFFDSVATAVIQSVLQTETMPQKSCRCSPMNNTVIIYRHYMHQYASNITTHVTEFNLNPTDSGVFFSRNPTDSLTDFGRI